MALTQSCCADALVELCPSLSSILPFLDEVKCPNLTFDTLRLLSLSAALLPADAHVTQEYFTSGLISLINSIFSRFLTTKAYCRLTVQCLTLLANVFADHRLLAKDILKSTKLIDVIVSVKSVAPLLILPTVCWLCSNLVEHDQKFTDVIFTHVAEPSIMS